MAGSSHKYFISITLATPYDITSRARCEALSVIRCCEFIQRDVIKYALVSDCRFGVSPVNYPDPDPDQVTSVISLLNLFLSKLC